MTVQVQQYIEGGFNKPEFGTERERLFASRDVGLISVCVLLVRKVKDTQSNNNNNNMSMV